MIALWLGVLVLFWIAYFRVTRGALTRHLGFLHFGIYFFAIYLGAYQIYVDNGSVDNTFMYSVVLYPLLALLGMVLAKSVGSRTTFDVTGLAIDRRETMLVCGMVAFFLGVYGVYLYSLGSQIPLVGVLTGGDLGHSLVARYLATKGYMGEGVGGLRVFFWLPRVMIDYFASFVLVYVYYRLRIRGRGAWGFLIVFLGLTVLTLLQVEKYPALKLFVILAACHFNYSRVRIRLRSLAWGAPIVAGSVFFFGVVYGVVSGNYRDALDMSLGEKIKFAGQLGWEMLTTRGMVGQAKALQVVFQIVPLDYPYFGGRTLTNPHEILPYTPVPLPYLVSDHYLINTMGIQGSDPTVFFGEVYANWGVATALASMVLFGFVVQMLHHALSASMDRNRTVFDVAFFYLLYLWLADFALSFSTLYFDERLWFFVLLFLMRRWIVRRRTVPALVTAGLPA